MSDRTAVYRIWRDNELLYIGVSYNPWLRYGHHLSAKAWAKTATKMEIEWHDTREDALRAERLAIATERPKSNILDVSGGIATKTGRAAPLASWLAKTGMTQADFALAIGIHFTAVCRVLKNERRPTKKQAQKIEALSGGAVPVSTWGFKTPKTKCPKFLEDVKRLHAKGFAYQEIAESLRVSSCTVSNVARGAGLRPNRQSPKSKYEDDIRALAARGLNQTQAATEMGVSPAIISATAKRLGVEFQDGRKNRKASEARVERVRNLAAMGLTVTQVAREIGVHQSEISKLKRRHKIEFPVSGKPVCNQPNACDGAAA